MDGHFRAFSFVDRIASVRPGIRIRGHYTIPSGLGAFPSSLVAEAVGQLAAWSAMAAVDFKARPVAGIAGGIELLSAAQPGQVLELDAELETADEEAVAYGGSASVNGLPVLRLQNCVGPMMPVEEFDDPAALRERFTLLCQTGATPGGFGGVPAVALDRTRNGQSAHAILQVPSSAPFFADHFPRRPVFPGSLLMHSNLELAAWLVAGTAHPASGPAWKLDHVSDMKLRTFIPPGERLEIEARFDERTETSAIVVVETRNAKRVVGGARVMFAAGRSS